jgi:hypothetical protein
MQAEAKGLGLHPGGGPGWGLVPGGAVPAAASGQDGCLRAAGHAPPMPRSVLEWDGRYEVVRMDVAGKEAGIYRTRGLATGG